MNEVIHRVIRNTVETQGRSEAIKILAHYIQKDREALWKAQADVETLEQSIGDLWKLQSDLIDEAASEK
jgi:hypothetical protein